MYISCCYKLLIIDADYFLKCIKWVCQGQRKTTRPIGWAWEMLANYLRKSFSFCFNIGWKLSVDGFFFNFGWKLSSFVVTFWTRVILCQNKSQIFKSKVLNDRWSIYSQLYMKIPQEFTPNLTELFKIDFWTITSWWKKYILERKRLRGS